MTENEKNMLKALARIEKWFGEFPHTGKFWENEDGTISDREMSYAACFGSNGERDYIRSIARDAINNFIEYKDIF